MQVQHRDWWVDWQREGERARDMTVAEAEARSVQATQIRIDTELADVARVRMLPVLPSRDVRRDLQPIQFAIKRALDIIFACVGLVALSPLLLIIALAIRLESRGPVFFSQVRAGVGGRPFRMYKFRTMIADADRLKKELQHLNESGDARLFKIRNDPRVTRVGRWLRRLSLDELPQLVNVVRGDMSLVGPRPFFISDLEVYEDHHFERLWVLPGITGLWQVSGRSDILDFEHVVALDRKYIHQWNILKDLMILIRTVPAAIGRGAY